MNMPSVHSARSGKAIAHPMTSRARFHLGSGLPAAPRRNVGVEDGWVAADSVIRGNSWPRRDGEVKSSGRCAVDVWIQEVDERSSEASPGLNELGRCSDEGFGVMKRGRRREMDLFSLQCGIFSANRSLQENICEKIELVARHYERTLPDKVCSTLRPILNLPICHDPMASSAA